MTPIADLYAQTSKQQFLSAMQIVDALAEGSQSMRGLQLDAAKKARDNAVSARDKALEAQGPAELVTIGSAWLMRNAEDSASYWSGLYTATLNTNGNLWRCLLDGMSSAQAQAAREAGTSENALLGIADDTFRQWLDANRGLYAFQETATAPG